MEKRNHKGTESNYAVWVAVIGGIFGVIVAVVNKKSEPSSKSSPQGGVNITVTTGESQKNEAPVSAHPQLPPKVSPQMTPTPCFNAKEILRQLDNLIVKSDNILKDRQDVARYEAWRSECSGVLSRLTLCKYSALTARHSFYRRFRLAPGRRISPKWEAGFENPAQRHCHRLSVLSFTQKIVNK